MQTGPGSPDLGLAPCAMGTGGCQYRVPPGGPGGPVRVRTALREPDRTARHIRVNRGQVEGYQSTRTRCTMAALLRLERGVDPSRGAGPAKGRRTADRSMKDRRRPTQSNRGLRIGPAELA